MAASKSNLNKIISDVSDIALKAGDIIHKIYDNNNYNVQSKSDKSPLTDADMASHDFIVQNLQKIDPNIPILSEEGKSIPFTTRSQWRKLWIVDPLDGTKEFIKRNGEFTVNIALVEAGVPQLGVIYAPVLDLLYGGIHTSEESFAWKKAGRNATERTIKTNKEKREKLNVVASRSHLNDETKNFIENLRKDHHVKTVSKGSSLKLCLVAEGTADVYPRFAPTMEWDTAAGDAILRAAGGITHQHEKETPLYYNKENLLNPWFIAKGRRE